MKTKGQLGTAGVYSWGPEEKIEWENGCQIQPPSVRGAYKALFSIHCLHAVKRKRGPGKRIVRKYEYGIRLKRYLLSEDQECVFDDLAGGRIKLRTEAFRSGLIKDLLDWYNARRGTSFVPQFEDL